jgi:hypothetical protein
MNIFTLLFMKKLFSIPICFLALLLAGFNDKKDLSNEQYLNFLAAIENSSTFNYFTVIKVKNLNTGVTKEICTRGNFICGALHIELKAGYDEKGGNKVLEFAKTKKDRYFEFSNNKALKNISFFDYDASQLSKVDSKYNLARAVISIKENKKFALTLTDKEMRYFAHLLFNKGYMTGESSCIGGTLKYVDRTNTAF